ncbi:hypothetical protein JR316_0012115 [Psilocybe cubensis]|uniref:Uncharacterized protein n=2 Tax=Psilocybe cubensis TaxID=181762 RepID=A0ACB8GIH7_PSICU|nr:hypothetical protein JR316_0012115 [Psilocybe cubensis]KAH9475016.1 hypothetical protein JR316_0012115 [Psilocybe cubensis]
MAFKISTAKSLRAALAQLDADIKDAVKRGEVKKMMRKLNEVMREVLRVKKAQTHPEIFKEFRQFLWLVVVDYKKSNAAGDFDDTTFVPKHRDALAKLEVASAMATSTSIASNAVEATPTPTSNGLPHRAPDVLQSAPTRAPVQSAPTCTSDMSQSAPTRKAPASQVSDIESTSSLGRKYPPAVVAHWGPTESSSGRDRKALNPTNSTVAGTVSTQAAAIKLTPSEATVLVVFFDSVALSNVLLKPNHASRALAELATSNRSTSSSHPVHPNPESSSRHAPSHANKPNQKSKPRVPKEQASKESFPTKSVGLFAHEVAMAHFDRPDSPENKFRALKLQRMLKEGPPQPPKSGSKYEESSENEESGVETGVKRKRSVKAATPTAPATKCNRCLKNNNKECQEIITNTGKRACTFCSKHKKGCTWGGTLVSKSRWANKASAAKASKRGPKGKQSEPVTHSNEEAMPPKKQVKSQQYVVDTDDASEEEKSGTEIQKTTKPSESVDYLEISSGSETPAPAKPASLKAGPSNIAPSKPTPSKSTPTPAPSTTVQRATPPHQLQDSDITDIPTIADFAKRINELEIMGCTTQVDLAILRTTNEDLQEELYNLKASYTSLKRSYDNLCERVSRHRNAAVDCQSAFGAKWEAGMRKMKAEVKHLSDSLDRTNDTLLFLEGRIDEIQMHQMNSDGAYLSEEFVEDMESAAEDGPTDGSIPMDLSSDDKAGTSANYHPDSAIDPVSDNHTNSDSDDDANSASDKNTNPASDNNVDPASDHNTNHAVIDLTADHTTDNNANPAADHGVQAVGTENVENVDGAKGASSLNPPVDFTPPQPPTTPPALPLSPPPPSVDANAL